MEYLYEMHAHTKEISCCAGCYAKDLVECYKDTEYYGIVLTNHMNSSTFSKKEFENATWDEKVDYFLWGYEVMKKEAGDRFQVILAMEINFYGHPNDYLVYGITENFLRSHGDLMAMEPHEFSRLAHENGLLMIQAHPFRRESQVEYWEILDGYEVFNGNPRHYSCNPMAEAWAKYHNKSIITAGSDFHEVEDAAHGGIYFKKPITNNEELLEELRKGDYRLKRDEIKHTRSEFLYDWSLR